jgi:hypothetical protein
MSKPDEYLATLYIEDHHGDQVWVTEQACQNRHDGISWIETQLNARRQAVAPGAAQGWYYMATFDKFPTPPITTASLRGPDTPIEWACPDTARSGAVARHENAHP